MFLLRVHPPISMNRIKCIKAAYTQRMYADFKCRLFFSCPHNSSGRLCQFWCVFMSTKRQRLFHSPFNFIPHFILFVQFFFCPRFYLSFSSVFIVHKTQQHNADECIVYARIEWYSPVLFNSIEWEQKGSMYLYFWNQKSQWLGFLKTMFKFNNDDISIYRARINPAFSNFWNSVNNSLLSNRLLASAIDLREYSQ